MPLFQKHHYRDKLFKPGDIVSFKALQLNIRALNRFLAHLSLIPMPCRHKTPVFLTRPSLLCKVGAEPRVILLSLPSPSSPCCRFIVGYRRDGMQPFIRSSPSCFMISRCLLFIFSPHFSPMAK